MAAPRFPDGKTIRRTFVEGESVDFRMPTDVVGGSGSFRYEWTVRPTLRGTGLTVTSAGRIHGTAGVRKKGFDVAQYGDWRATDQNPAAGDPEFVTVRVTIVIHPANRLELGRPAHFVGRAGDRMSRVLPDASGGTAPRIYSLIPHASTANRGLPLSNFGILFNPSTRALSSERLKNPGISAYLYRCTDADGVTRQHGFFITVQAGVTPPRTDPLSLSPSGDWRVDGRRGDAMDVSGPTARGGTPPYTYSLTGLALSSVGLTGSALPVPRISGTPTGALTDTGLLTVRDSASPSQRASATVRLSIRDTAEDRTLGNDLSFTYDDGTAVSISLPQLSNPRGTVAYGASWGTDFTDAGLSISLLTRLLTGTAAGEGDSARTVTAHWRATDQSDGRLFTIRISISIRPPAIVVPDLSLSPAGDWDVRGVSGSPVDDQGPTARGGTRPYRYSISGLALSGTGLSASGSPVPRITGTPSRAVNDNGLLTATDSSSPAKSATARIRLRIDAQARGFGSDITRSVSDGEQVSIALPALSNALGSVSYSAHFGTAFTEAGLSIDVPSRRVTGAAAGAGAERTVTASWTATDSGDGARFTINIRITVLPRDMLEFRDQSPIDVTEKSSVTTAIRPASGGSGSVRYEVLPDNGGLSGTGLELGTIRGIWTISGTTASVDADIERTVIIRAVDDEDREGTSRLSLRIRDVPDGPIIELADDLVDVYDAFSGTIELQEAGGDPVGDLTYAYAHTSGVDPTSDMEISLDASRETLTFALTTSDMERESLGVRTVTDSASTPNEASAELRIVARARLRWSSDTHEHHMIAGRYVGSQTVDARILGGKQPYRVEITGQISQSSGLIAASGGSTVRVAGTPVRGTHSFTARATDAHDRTADVTVDVVVAGSDAFAFDRETYRRYGEKGGAVTWQLPLPRNGSVASYSVSPAPPAGIGSPEVFPSTGLWSMFGGPITADVGDYTLTLTAVSTDGETATATLIASIVSPFAGSPIFGGCGKNRRKFQRNPRNPDAYAVVVGDVEPDETGLGPIRSFAPDKLIASPDETLTFSWEVERVFSGIPIVEVDFYYTEPSEPFCGVLPNLIPTPSVEHRSSIRIKTPRMAGVHLYRLVALRGGTSERYVSADWWDVRVLVTDEAAAVHVSHSKERIPSGYPVVLQWEYKGPQPTGDQLLGTDPVEPEGVTSPIQVGTPPGSPGQGHVTSGGYTRRRSGRRS